MLLQRSKLAAATLERPRLIAPWLILLTAALLLVVLALIFPFKTLVERVIATNRDDPLTVSYLHNLLRTDPQNPELRLVLARRQLSAGDLGAARDTLRPVITAADIEVRGDGLWLMWQIREKEMQRWPPGAPERTRLVAALREELRDLGREQLPPSIKRELADKALAYDERELALRSYAALPEGMRPTGKGGTLDMARAALGEGDYRGAALIYLAERDRAATLEKKREYFLLAMRALQSGDRNREALALAEAELKELRHDRETLLFLVGLARAAGRIDLADKYMRALLRLTMIEQWQRVLAATQPATHGARLRRVAYADATAELPGPQLPFDDKIYVLGYDVFLQNRKPGDAYRVAASAVRQVPANLEWRERLAKVAEWTGRPKVALDNWLFIAQRRNSDDAWSQVLRLAPGLFNDEALLPALQRKLTRSPGDPALVKDIVALYERLGEPRQALDFLQPYAERAPALLQEMAALAERAGDDDRAIALLRRLEKQEGVSSARAMHLATLLLVQGRSREALDALDRARDVATAGDGDYWRLTAQLARALQDDDIAIAAYDRLAAQEALEEGDYDPLIGLLREAQPLRAGRLAEQAWRRFGKPRMLMASLYLLAGQERWHDMARLFDAPDAEQLARLQQDGEFLRLRAQHHLALGRPRLAQRDLESALHLEPDSTLLRETLIWLLVDSNDSDGLRVLLARHENVWRADAALHGALAGAHQALSQTALALRYLTPLVPQRRHDFLWLMNYADALEQNAEVDRAWRLRQQLWRERGWLRLEQAGDGYERGVRALAAARRVARTRLALSQEPGDASLAALRELLRADVDESQALSPAARELVLAWWQNPGEHSAERGFLWQQYARNMARPLWAEMSAALALDDVAEIGALLDRHADRLPRYDRVNAARRVDDVPLAASYAFDTQTVQPDDDETHFQLADALLDQAHWIGFGLARRAVGVLDESERSLHSEARLASRARLGLQWGRIGRGSRDEETIAGVPGSERFVLASLRWRHNEGETRISTGQRQSFDRYRPLELVREQEVTRRVSLTATLGLRIPAPESTALRVGGMRDTLSLGGQYRLSRYDRLSGQWSRLDYALQNGTPVGKGSQWEVEYVHAFRLELRDLEAAVFASRYRFDARGDLGNDAGFVRYRALLPLSIQALLARPAPAAEDLQAVDAAVRGLLPSGFNLYGLRLSTNTRLQRDYTRALRPFASISLTHNSVTGSGYGALLGVAGSILGSDHFQVGWQLDKGGSASFDRTRQWVLSYRLFF
jgi:hypothetical protein